MTPVRAVKAALLATALVSAVVVSSRGITDEGSVTMQGDMARHMMNGVLIYDFIRDGGAASFEGVLDYARHYYARYPALSLGHHPPLLPAILVPFYAVFGVSVFAARLAIMACFLASALLLFAIGRRLYDATAGAWAALLFVTSPYIVAFSQTVMSEMPTLMCVLLAMHRLFRFRDTGRVGDFGLFVAAVVASLVAKQTAIFVAPAYLTLLLDAHGRSRLLRRDIVAWTLLGAVLALPVAAYTLLMSPFNVSVLVEAFARARQLGSAELSLALIRDAQIRPALLLAATAGLMASLIRRDKRILLGAAWMLIVVGGVILVLGTVEPERYSIVAVPAYCLCAASLVTLEGWPRRLGIAVLAGAVASQAWTGRELRPVGAGGYEEAAQAVLRAEPGPTVMFSGVVDSGFFTFFMRKNDTARQTVVLRSDKILTTSQMGLLAAQDRISDVSEIYQALDTFGTRYIVIEDQPTGSIVLDWLRAELQTDRFAERARFPIRTTDRRLRGVTLVVYEYLDAGPPDPGAVIDIDIPLVANQVRIPLAELTDVAELRKAPTPREAPLAAP